MTFSYCLCNIVPSVSVRNLAPVLDNLVQMIQEEDSVSGASSSHSGSESTKPNVVFFLFASMTVD